MESFEVSMLDTDDVACRIGNLQKVIEAHQKRAHQHLQLAAKVHRSLLPLPVQTDRIDVDVRYLPVEQVGGDYCQVRFPSEDVCYITMCDVTGHGIGAAWLATRVSSEVRHSVLSGKSLTEVLDSSGSELGESGLAAIAVSERSDDLFGMTDSILERIHAFQHGPATDDRTLILIGLK
jgi:serine phosphatase RsbU (regulator of sigma subunit)